MLTIRRNKKHYSSNVNSALFSIKQPLSGKGCILFF